MPTEDLNAHHNKRPNLATYKYALWTALCPSGLHLVHAANSVDEVFNTEPEV